MAGPGGGPSRRSHTKSRKGCRTCKKRHIRCDEAFPQCRNCSKHQVRCDYQDAAAGEEEPTSPPQINLLMTPEIERVIDLWRRSGQHPFPHLASGPQPHWPSYSLTEMRLIHNLLSISNEMHASQSDDLTIWTSKIQRFLSTAAYHPFVMHAILAFSASNLAWRSQSSATRNLAWHHSGIALRGLHEAISEFSQQNSDAVLVASVMLAWKAPDWRGWASLMTGTRAVINAMQPWKHESQYQDLIADQRLMTAPSFLETLPLQTFTDSQKDPLPTLQHIYSSLQRLHPYLAGRDQEMRWIEQLKGYLQQIRSSTPGQSAEEQFGQLYRLRKWLFWVPVHLLSLQGRDFSALVVMAYLYATSLALEPLYPNVGATLCADVSVRPLDEIIRTLDIQSTVHGHAQNAYTAATLLEFPRETLTLYRTRIAIQQQQAQQMNPVRRASYGLENINREIESHFAKYRFTDGMSPAFPPSPLDLPGGPSTSGQVSPFLEVPRSTSFGDSWSASSSSYGSLAGTPGLPKEGNQGELSQGYNFSYTGGMTSGPWPREFVHMTPTLWT